MVRGIPQAANHYLQGRTVMFDFRKMAVSLSVLSITAATTTTLASAQEAALSEGERQGLAACLVKCPDGDKACNNRCISKSQTRASCGAMLRALASEVVGLNIDFLRYPPKRRPMRYLVV